jgi:hypothetical protein
MALFVVEFRASRISRGLSALGVSNVPRMCDVELAETPGEHQGSTGGRSRSLRSAAP